MILVESATQYSSAQAISDTLDSNPIAESTAENHENFIKYA